MSGFSLLFDLIGDPDLVGVLGFCNSRLLGGDLSLGILARVIGILEFLAISIACCRFSWFCVIAPWSLPEPRAITGKSMTWVVLGEISFPPGGAWTPSDKREEGFFIHKCHCVVDGSIINTCLAVRWSYNQYI